MEQQPRASIIPQFVYLLSVMINWFIKAWSFETSGPVTLLLAVTGSSLLQCVEDESLLGLLVDVAH